MQSLFGNFKSSEHIQIHEASVIATILSKKMKSKGRRLLVDVGACQGDVSTYYAKMNWDVIALEPDPHNFIKLKRNLKNLSKVTALQLAISDTDDQTLNFYTSRESPGISSLVPFTKGHKLVGTVKTKKLASLVKELEIEKIDFLKIDTEGLDYIVLQSLAWRVLPGAILMEFDNQKDIPKEKKYSLKHMADYLQEKGYQVFVSEWHPIRRYGTSHSFKALKRYPCKVSEKGWGNIIAFKEAVKEETVIKAYKRQLTLQMKIISKCKDMLASLRSDSE